MFHVREYLKQDLVENNGVIMKSTCEKLEKQIYKLKPLSPT